MNKNQILTDKQEEFINYLIQHNGKDDKKIPAINEISKELGVSTACLREQIELAKNMGLIRLQPRKGIEILPYSFTPAVIKSLYYAIKVDKSYFDQFSEMRNHLEKSFFIDAVKLLNDNDIAELKRLIKTAVNKLRGEPIQIPHNEHRRYHLLIYRQLKNVFLNGMLEAYWDMYEMAGLDVYTDLDYLESVWEFHRRIAECIERKEFIAAYDMQIEHMQLIYQR